MFNTNLKLFFIVSLVFKTIWCSNENNTCTLTGTIPSNVKISKFKYVAISFSHEVL